MQSPTIPAPTIVVLVEVIGLVRGERSLMK